ncbi:MAG: hypothetical protein ACT4QE_19850 [Anaerolineales bacterium]
MPRSFNSFKLGLILLCVLSGVLAASAQTGLPATLTGGPNGDAHWNIVPDGGTSDGSPFPNAECANVVNPGIMVDDTLFRDAYDQAGIWINGRVFTSTVASVTTTNMTAGPMFTTNGISVTLNYSALISSPTLRTLISAENPTAASRPITITFAVNFGSDLDTRYLATSSGDMVFAGNDRWAVSADGTTTVTDVVNSTAVFGLGNPSVIPSFADDQVFACPGGGNAQEGILAEFQFSVPANSTRRLMIFQQINGTPAEALNVVGMFDAPMRVTNPLAAGLLPQQLAEIQNWRDFYPVYLPLIRK